MKICAFFLLFLGCFSTATGQKFIERVYLKDSSFHEGYIIEQEPTKLLKIDRIKQKDTVTVPFTDIWKITKVYITDSVKTNKKKAPAISANRYLKAIYGELLGNGGLYSVNFDMRTAKGRRDGWGIRAGFEYLGLATDSAGVKQLSVSLLGLPFAVNYLFGKKRGFLELGLGATWLRGKAKARDATTVPSDDETFNVPLVDIEGKGAIIVGTFNIGYRYVPYENGIMFRAMLTPFIVTDKIIPFVGFSLGYKF